jgi:glycosyltransferase EpsF
MSALRVLQVFGGMEVGGAETLMMNVYRRMDRTRVQFDFAVNTNQKCHYDDEIRSLGGRVFPHPLPAKSPFAYRRAFQRTLREAGPFAAVHSHVHHFSGVCLQVASRQGVGIRIAHSHTTADGQANTIGRFLYRSEMRRLIARHASHLLCAGPASGEALFGSRCWDEPRTRILPNGIDLAALGTNDGDRRSLRQTLLLPEDALVVGHVGRFVEVKNHRFIVEMFRSLVETRPEAVLVLVGDGPLRTTVEAQVRESGLAPRVRFLGTRQDIFKVLGALDVFVFPSIYEGVPTAVIEAQAAGLPCLISSTLPREVNLGLNLVFSIPLSESPAAWALLLQRALSVPRPALSARRSALAERGYDIGAVAAFLTALYCTKPASGITIGCASRC